MKFLVELCIEGLDERSARKALQDARGNAQYVAHHFQSESEKRQHQAQVAERMAVMESVLVGDPEMSGISRI